MTQHQPPVSIVMPCYNSIETLAQALDGVLALDYAEYELIVVDDCSTDDSLAVLRRYAEAHPLIRVFRLERNGGVQGARDFGARQARFGWIASTDSDAVVPRDWLSRAARNFADADLVAGVFLSRPETWIEKSLDSMSLNRQQSFSRFDRTTTRVDPYAGGANMFFTKAVFEAVGGYDQRFRAGEDLLLVAKAIEAGYRLSFDPEVAVYHPFSPRCRDLREFLRRNWEAHKWRKVMGKSSRLIRNRNLLMVGGAAGIPVLAVAAGVAGGRGVALFLAALGCLLVLQAYRGMRKNASPFVYCLAGACLKLVRRVVGGMAIVLPGGPSRFGWSKRF